MTSNFLGATLNSYQTEHLIISNPESPSISGSDLHKICPSTDSEARNVRLGTNIYLKVLMELKILGFQTFSIHASIQFWRATLL